MYFDFEDYHPDFTPVGRAISWREGVLLSIIVHLALIILVLVAPRFLPQLSPAGGSGRSASRTTRNSCSCSRGSTSPALKPPDRGEPSDQDRVARAPAPAPDPKNPLPFSRGNTPERVEEPPREVAARAGTDAGAGRRRAGAKGRDARARSLDGAGSADLGRADSAAPVRSAPALPPAPQSARAGGYGNASVPAG